MSTFSQRIEIGDFDARRFEAIEALVDTGATYTSMPRDILSELAVTPTEERAFILGNGQRAFYGFGWIRVRLEDKEQPTPVIFGDVGSPPLLGAVTLEEFGLAVDPVNHRLVPATGYLVGIVEDSEGFANTNN
jgi:aspartyl protease family protein